jgi:hypothetical protein
MGREGKESGVRVSGEGKGRLGEGRKRKEVR